MTVPEQPQTTPEPSAPPAAEPQNTSTADENRIPQSRFNQVLAEKKALEDRLTQLEAAENQRKQAEMSDLEKATAQAAEAETKRQALEQQLQTERQARLDDKRDNALAQALATAGAHDADGLVLILKARQQDVVASLMAADGSLDADAIKALVDKVKVERAHDFQSAGPGSPSNRGGSVTTPANVQAAELAKQVKQQYGYDLDAESLGKRMQMYEDLLGE